MHIFVSGAGPVGLSAAVSLAARGHDVTIADRQPGITGDSRAVGVSRETLNRLAPSGAAARILEEAVLIRTGRVMVGDTLLARLKIPRQDDHPPSLVGIPQTRTEQILLDVFTRLGGTVLWNHETTALAQTPDHVEATLTDRATGATTPVRADYAFGADGSHSAVRNFLNIDFAGRALEGVWSVADAQCAWPWTEEAAAVLSNDGLVSFFIAIGGGRYRLVANHPDVVETAQRIGQVEDVQHAGEFEVNLRVAEVFGVGRVAIGGDAAHVHSPVGGRGMNLGIGDAFAFAEAVEAHDLPRYRAARLAAAQATVRWTHRFYRFVTAASPVGIIARNNLLRTAGAISRLLP